VINDAYTYVTVFFGYIATGLPHDNGTGLDLSRSSFYL